ncbi:MAG: hypothetical protein HOQ06_06850, partial [Pseudarthrobacter sp.]|nr:hypothetical protein [Pseudarthrobacter sp.]
ISGRLQQRDMRAALRTAVEEDRKRRRRSAPSLPIVALAAKPPSDPSLTRSGCGAVWLRLGQAEQKANVRFEPAGGALSVPSAGSVPVMLDPGRPLTVVAGPGPAVDGLIRSLVMQLAGYPRARTTHVVIHGKPGGLPLAARYLRGVTLTSAPSAGLEAVREGATAGQRQVVIIRGTATRADADERLRDAALEHGCQVIQVAADESVAGKPDVLLSERGSTLRGTDRETFFIPDLAPEEVFTRFCRRMAAAPQQPHPWDHTVPTACGLAEILPLSAPEVRRRWDTSPGSDGLIAPLGVGADGTRTIDLHGDGPHLLVAGTTGSGKSELLRSLVLGLVLSYPPDRVNFFFVDFKGGSGLAPLTALVHCVGLQTDLSGHELERTLTSLRAEVRLREERLAAARVPDVAAYRSSPAADDFPLPHLVVVIDEFRMLVDDAPGVLRELLRIASIGRSLGIHLVMATQRPQGALTADIRANVTSSIALRVQSEMESVDIINSKAAAAISVDIPGRAFLVRGMEPAQEFQAASLLPAPAQTHQAAVSVQLTTDYLDTPEPAGQGANAPQQTPAQAVAPLAALVKGLCGERGDQLPRLPVAAPLPDELDDPAGEQAATGHSPENEDGLVHLGLVDLPAKQLVGPLEWDPAKGGHVAFIGSPSSGADEGLELLVARLMSADTEAHFYFLDSTGTFLPAAAAGRTGAHAGLHELRRAVRILERLAQELGRRLSRPHESGIPLVLVIAGWGSWVSAFRSGPLAWAEDLVQDLVRDGARAKITVLMGGERELVTARFYGALPTRFYFPAGSSEESRAAWPRMPSVPPIRGRAVAFGPVSQGGQAVCQFYRLSATTAAAARSSDSARLPTGSRPFRVEPLPDKIAAAQVRALGQHGHGQSSGAERPGQRRMVLFGVAGDDLAAASIRIPEGGVMAVLGGPGSGKSNVLRALRALNPGSAWAYRGQAESGEEFWNGLRSKAESGLLPKETVLLADDIDVLAAGPLRDLGHLHALGHALIVTANYSATLHQRIPLIMTARSAGTGLLLAPRSIGDGDIFGVRFELEPNPPPGRGVLIAAGRPSPVQVAWAGTED